MRRATLVLALLLAACDLENGQAGHAKLVRVIAPIQLDRATIAVDGTQTSWLMSVDLEHPVRELLARVLGRRQRPFVSGSCPVPAGTHTIRIVKPGWEPIERTVQ